MARQRTLTPARPRYKDTDSSGAAGKSTGDKDNSALIGSYTLHNLLAIAPVCCQCRSVDDVKEEMIREPTPSH